MIPLLQFAWLNIFAFAVCLAGPYGSWSADPSVSMNYTIRTGSETTSVLVWSTGDVGVTVCHNSHCTDYPVRDLSNLWTCQLAFDDDADGDVDLRDWARLTTGIVTCESGRCLRMVKP